MYLYFYVGDGRIVWSSRYFFSAMLPAITAANFTEFIIFELGSAVNVFFLQPSWQSSQCLRQGPLVLRHR